MKERPILFSSAMVRAILEGRKTQTRRVIKSQPPSFCPYLTRCGGDFRWGWSDGSTVDFAWHPRGNGADMDSMWMTPPHGIPGDRLWVREAWGVGSRPDPWGGYDGIEYRADEGFIDPEEKYPVLECRKVDTPEGVCLGDIKSGWRPSIFMPRWASRITLEITDVRVQRLQEISEEDAKAEGVEPFVTVGTARDKEWYPEGYRANFKLVWDSINGKKHPWESNPWVWALTFRRAQ